MNASGGGGEASQPPGEGANPFPPDRPGKRALWELLAHHYPQGATMATLADDPRLQEVSRPARERRLQLAALV